jgi:hypothetical protein
MKWQGWFDRPCFVQAAAVVVTKLAGYWFAGAMEGS